MLFLDESIITETPPLRAAWALRGHQAQVPITGNRSKRVIFGAINHKTGSLTLMKAERWNQDTYQAFLRKLRCHWRGWHIILFLDRGSPHKAKRSRELARSSRVEERWLPTACPELNPMEGLWRHLKQEVLANSVTPVDEAAEKAHRYLLEMSPQERRSRAGIMSKHFWLGT